MFGDFQQQDLITIMGNQTATINKVPSQMDIQSPHDMLNNTKIIRKSGKQLLQASWPFYSEFTYKKWEKEYKCFLDKVFETNVFEDCPEPLAQHFLLPLSYSYSNVNMCSPSGIVTMYYSPVKKSLVQDIQDKRQRNDPYRQQQLWILLHLLTKTVNFLHRKQVPLGDTRPENIFIDLEGKTIKISTEVSWIGEPGFKQKIGSNMQIFMSPQLIEARQQHCHLTNDLIMGNDDFGIGMTMAQCILLEDLSKVYEFGGICKQIIKHKFEAVIQKLLKTNYYSLKLLLIVVGMILPQGQDRISSREVCRLLRNRQKVIINGQKFTLTKEDFTKQIPKKYKALQHRLDTLKRRNSGIIFDNKQTFPSRSFTIPDVSAIKNAKKNDLQVSQFEMFNFSAYSGVKTPQQSRMIPPASHQSVLTTELKDPHFNNSFHNQPLSRQSPQIVEKFNYEPPQAKFSNRQQSPHSFVPSERKSQFSVLAVSDVKQFQKPNKHLVFQKQNQISQSLEQREFKPLQQRVITQNFSFHSPEGMLKQERGSSRGLQQEEKYQQVQTDTAINQLQQHEFTKSNESLLLMPSVYAVSNAPESYISYHYTKSVKPRPKKDDDDQCRSFQTKVFQFEKESPPSIKLRKKSQENFSAEEKHNNEIQQFKRRTIGNYELNRDRL